MKEYELVERFVDVCNQMKVEGYFVKSKNGFLIFNCNEETVAEVQTVDGLAGFLSGVQSARRCNS
jgi:anaerobic ribonucleoside-triphosphate reductase